MQRGAFFGRPEHEHSDFGVAALLTHGLCAEELWSKLGGSGSVVYAPFPTADAALLVEEEIERLAAWPELERKLKSKVKVEIDKLRKAGAI